MKVVLLLSNPCLCFFAVEGVAFSALFSQTVPDGWGLPPPPDLLLRFSAAWLVSRWGSFTPWRSAAAPSGSLAGLSLGCGGRVSSGRTLTCPAHPQVPRRPPPSAPSHPRCGCQAGVGRADGEGRLSGGGFGPRSLGRGRTGWGRASVACPVGVGPARPLGEQCPCGSRFFSVLLWFGGTVGALDVSGQRWSFPQPRPPVCLPASQLPCSGVAWGCLCWCAGVEGGRPAGGAASWGPGPDPARPHVGAGQGACRPEPLWRALASRGWPAPPPSGWFPPQPPQARGPGLLSRARAAPLGRCPGSPGGSFRRGRAATRGPGAPGGWGPRGPPENVSIGGSHT